MNGQQHEAAMADFLTRATGLCVYGASVSYAEDRVLAFARDGGSKWVLVAAPAPKQAPFNQLRGRRISATWQGTKLEIAMLLPTHEAAVALRQFLPWAAPSVIGLRCSAGLGDRLGLATPGHAQAVRNTGIVPYFAQQSIREMTRTQRTPEQVMDAATWGVFQAGWRDGFGSDADHLKTSADADACVAAGFTMFTIDPGDHVRSDADSADSSALHGWINALPWDRLETTVAEFRNRYVGHPFPLAGGGEVVFTEDSLARAAIKYGEAVAHTAAMYRHIRARMGARPFELEVSVDETAAPTSTLEHYLIAAELRRLGVHWIGLAPRFVGEFEKGIDYKGDPAAFEKSFAGHVAVARTLGPYKLSIHSGSDKFTIYPIAARLAGGLIHLKTAGTSYLEALRVVARRRPELFRRILGFALSRFEKDRASYHISANLGRIPRTDDLPDDRLEPILDGNDGRQLLHVTFGSVLTAAKEDDTPLFRDEIVATLLEHEREHFAVLESHLGRHVRPFIANGSQETG